MKTTLVFTFLVFVTKCTAFFEGDACVVIHSNGTFQAGKCGKFSACNFAKNLVQNYRKPQICGFIGIEPLVCCPIDLKQKVAHESVAEKRCRGYHDSRFINYVAHGQKANPREFPHMAAIGFGTKNAKSWFCGGSLISLKFVLTAARCTIHRELGTAKWVRLGNLDLHNTTEDSIPLEIEIDKIFVHPQYTSASHYNDIALLKLKSIIAHNSYILPACLQTKKELPTTKVEVAGWDRFSFGGDPSSHFLKATLTVIKHENCTKMYPKATFRKLTSGIMEDLQICACYDLGRDTCPDISGGPLHYLHPGEDFILDYYLIVGITSFGRFCGSESNCGVYTRVSSYVPWIESIVWPSME